MKNLTLITRYACDFHNVSWVSTAESTHSGFCMVSEQKRLGLSMTWARQRTA